MSGLYIFRLCICWVFRLELLYSGCQIDVPVAILVLQPIKFYLFTSITQLLNTSFCQSGDVFDTSTQLWSSHQSKTLTDDSNLDKLLSKMYRAIINRFHLNLASQLATQY